MSNINCHFGLPPQSTQDWFFQEEHRQATTAHGTFPHSPQLAWHPSPRRCAPGPGLHSESTAQDTVLAGEEVVVVALEDRGGQDQSSGVSQSALVQHSEGAAAWVAVESNGCAHLGQPLPSDPSSPFPSAFKRAAQVGSYHVSVHWQHSGKPCVHT